MQKKSYSTLFLVFIFAAPLSLQAELYKGVNEEGNVTFSDKETPNSEVIPMHMPSVIPMPKPKPAEKDTEGSASETSYKIFQIKQPVNDTVVRKNNGNISISLTLEPALDTEAGHNISISLDGKVTIKNTTSLTGLLSNVDRGTHTVQATIKNKKGKIIKTSNSVVFHLQRVGLTRAPHAIIDPERPDVIIYTGPGPLTAAYQPGPIIPRAVPLENP